MTYSPGRLITQLQKAPFTWALGRCHWWVILGHQQMSRATQGLSPAPWCGLPTAVLPQDLDTELSGTLSALCCPGLFPMTTLAEPPCRKGFNVFASTCKHMATCLTFGTRSKTVWGNLK